MSKALFFCADHFFMDRLALCMNFGEMKVRLLSLNFFFVSLMINGGYILLRKNDYKFPETVAKATCKLRKQYYNIHINR